MTTSDDGVEGGQNVERRGELRADEPTDEQADGAGWSLVNWAIVGVFTVLTVAGMALAVGYVNAVVAVPEGGTDSQQVTVPLFVFLYSGFGALGYVFTKLMVGLDGEAGWNRPEHLAAMAMRIPAAWILAAGIYLLVGEVAGTGGTASARFAAGVAFLVGLYVNVAHKALGSVADRVLGRTPRRPE
jgi:hypothetical protein